MKPPMIFLTLALAGPLSLAACGDGDDPAGDAPTSEAATAVDADANVDADADIETATDVVLVSPADAAATIANPPADLVILDVRTPEEFAAGHIDGAVMLDFYEPTFADDLAALDRGVPYVLYCRSGNRSGQTRSMMADLGFESVEDVDGGILAWEAAGQPVTGS